MDFFYEPGPIWRIASQISGGPDHRFVRARESSHLISAPIGTHPRKFGVLTVLHIYKYFLLSIYDPFQVPRLPSPVLISGTAAYEERAW
jgi:hypothetical protein